MFNRISQLLKWGVARFADANGARLTRPDGSQISIPYSMSFQDFSPSILASFVAGSMASQAGNTVTVAAAGHGIIGSAAKNGYRIYFPGSTSIPAGWYGGFAWIDANTVSFQRTASASIANEAVNGGAAMLATVTICSATLPGGSLGSSGRVTAKITRNGDATSASKIIRFLLDGVIFGAASVTTSPSVTQSMSIAARSSSTQSSSPSPDGAVSSVGVMGYIDTSVDKSMVLTGQLSAAPAHLTIEAAEVEVVRR